MRMTGFISFRLSLFSLKWQFNENVNIINEHLSNFYDNLVIYWTFCVAFVDSELVIVEVNLIFFVVYGTELNLNYF